MRYDNIPLMVFAAGAGTRMAPITDYCPKPLIHVAGKPLIDHALDPALALNFEKIVVNTSYKAELLKPHLASSRVTVIHETVRLETGGGLKNALPVLGGGPTITTNSDAVWAGSNPYKFLLNAWKPTEMECLLLLVPKRNAHGHNGKGDFKLDTNGIVQRGRDLIYSGVQIVNSDCVTEISDTVFSMNKLWDRLIEKRQVFAVVYDGLWCDVGHPNSIKTAREMVALNV